MRSFIIIAKSGNRYCTTSSRYSVVKFCVFLFGWDLRIKIFSLCHRCFFFFFSKSCDWSKNIGPYWRCLNRKNRSQWVHTFWEHVLPWKKFKLQNPPRNTTKLKRDSEKRRKDWRVSQLNLSNICLLTWKLLNFVFKYITQQFGILDLKKELKWWNCSHLIRMNFTIDKNVLDKSIVSLPVLGV